MDNVPDRLRTLVNYELGNASQFEVYQIGTADALEFHIPFQDYTIGHILKQELASRPEVAFVGLKMPHPLDNKIVIRLQLHPQKMLADPDITPELIMFYALDRVSKSVEEIEQAFESALSAFTSG